MFMDAASAHSLKGLKVSDNMTIEKIPPYAPDVNPSENIWGKIREIFFGNIAFDSMGAVEDRLVEVAKYYENHQEIIQSIAGWEWILSTY